MTLGLIVRADEGGLGTQTWEYARHLAADRLLVVQVEPHRGEFLPERYDTLGAVTHVRFPPESLAPWADFVSECDTILTAETTYLPDLGTMCKRAGTRLVVHANPELWEWGHYPPFEVWAPTSWQARTFPADTPVIPMPVDRERCAPRPVADRPRRILHVSAPAMLDRNGSHLLKEALASCTVDFELHVSGPEAPAEPAMVGPVKVIPVPSVRNYWNIYEGMDGLVLPRRYGGLCLPMQEAASCGLPIISLAVSPQVMHLAPTLMVPARLQGTARMKGGTFQLHQCDPQTLAQMLDSYCTGTDLPAQVAASEAWAVQLDWATWAPIYREHLDGRTD